jgi:hypothetical protein
MTKAVTQSQTDSMNVADTINEYPETIHPKIVAVNFKE